MHRQRTRRPAATLGEEHRGEGEREGEGREGRGDGLERRRRLHRRRRRDLGPSYLQGKVCTSSGLHEP
ncbi:hypothetical protein U9M48_012569 [Paspalum notatum var. saurae]|uniref:Uncharacterized protein n=1 Tax=Paspalum notatum var. saurae TaxID=547442 RepID=A0AAQ3WIJ0_PASNO